MPVMTEFIFPKQYCSNIRIVLKLDTIAHSCRRLGCSCFVPTCCRLDFQLKKIARLSSQATFCTVCLGLPSSLLQSRDSSQPGLWKFSVETAQHVSKVITWKRSVSSLSSSSRSPFTTSMIKDDAGDSSSDFVEQFSMVSGSHSSTLDRLYAWERKLHDEIKQKTNWKILPPIHQRGRTVEIFNSFELVLDPVSGTLYRAFLEKKQELYKKVFPKFYVLGWYSTGSDVQETDMLIHKALMDINESPVYLLLNPAINLSQKDLPVTIYESVW